MKQCNNIVFVLLRLDDITNHNKKWNKGRNRDVRRDDITGESS